ncbi:MAG: alpha/beta fold hydrolase [Myxococcales bacterium]
MAVLSILNQIIRKDLVRSGVASRTVRLAGAEVHYYDAPGVGRAPPLLLVHGFGDSANTWYQLIGPLARELGRVYALDLPGVGFSKLPAGRDHLDLAESIEVVRAFCAEVIREPCLLVGQSLGGAMVLRLGGRDVHPWTGVAAVAPAGARMTEAEWLDLRAAFDVPDLAAARALLQRIFISPPIPLVLIERDLRAVWRSTPVRKLMESLRPDDFLTPEELARIRVPALVLWGTDERLLPPTLLGYYREKLPQARIEVVHGWGHAPQQERPAELAARLVQFALGLTAPKRAVAR